LKILRGLCHLLEFFSKIFTKIFPKSSRSTLRSMNLYYEPDLTRDTRGASKALDEVAHSVDKNSNIFKCLVDHHLGLWFCYFVGQPRPAETSKGDQT
jgi:hypothetical protein